MAMASNQESVRKHGFYCPVSPHVAWCWGLAYQDCPVAPQERDSDECRNCPLRGAAEFRRDKGRPKREDRDRDKSSRPHGQRKKQGTHGGEKGKAFVG